jgi:hypothetical protein
MSDLFNHSTNEKLHHKKLISDVEKTVFNIENITLIKVLDSTHCDVVARDHKGHRSYKVTLEKNAKFTYFYRVFDVKGQKLISPYQYERTL